MGAGVGLRAGVEIIGGALVVAVAVVGGPKFSAGSVGGGAERAGAPNPVNPVKPLKRGGLVTGSSFFSAGAGTGGAAPSRERNEGASVVMAVVAKGVSPEMLRAGARVGAAVETDIEGGAKLRLNEGGSPSVDDDEDAAVVVAAVVEGAVAVGLPRNPSEGFGASAFGAAGAANNEAAVAVAVAVAVSVEGLVGSVLVTVIAGRVVGAAVLNNPPFPELAPAALESTTRALSFSNALASASRFSSMLSMCRPGMPLAPAGRAHDVRPFCIPDQLGIPPPGVVVSCRTVIKVPPFRAGVLGCPPPLESEAAVWRPGVVGLAVVDGDSRRESRFERPGVVGIEPMMGLGLVGRLVLDTPRILPLFHISALPGESLPDPGPF